MVIWSGWGILVAVFFFVGCAIGYPIGGLISSETNISGAISILFGGLAGGLSTFVLARKIEGAPGRAFIDESTQQRVVVRPSAGSLFFIPTRYWAYILPVLSIVFAVAVVAD